MTMTNIDIANRLACAFYNTSGITIDNISHQLKEDFLREADEVLKIIGEIEANNIQKEIEKDKINPSHYKTHPSGIECIEITRHLNFNVGNAIKYLWRNGLKDNESSIDDLNKAIWYINDEIERLETSK